MPKRLDLVGKRFGRLTVLSFAEAKRRGKETHPRAFWLCQCDCGNTKVICSADLRQGATQSCGCRKLEWASTLGRSASSRRAPKDIIGQVFGRLTVLSLSAQPNYRVHWLCLCECGGKKVVSGLNLRTGRTRSCGCLHRENALRQAILRKGLPSPNRTHGKSRTPAYRTWSSMIQRCENSNNPKWRDYGGRGIAVCERWHNFGLYEADILSEIGPKPPGSSIDRIKNDKGYEPGNVQWATQKQQVANQRKRKRVDVFTDAELLAELERRGAAVSFASIINP